MLHTSCDRCRQRISTPHAPPGASGARADAGAHMGDSYVVLPSDKRRAAPLPDLSQTLRPGDSVLQATSMHEQLRTVSRLLGHRPTFGAQLRLDPGTGNFVALDQATDGRVLEVGA